MRRKSRPPPPIGTAGGQAALGLAQGSPWPGIADVVSRVEGDVADHEGNSKTPGSCRVSLINMVRAVVG